MTDRQLVILSGGAANGLVNALAATLQKDIGFAISGTFGAVGAMRDKLLAGAPADLLILTRALIDALAQSGHVDPGSIRDIGVVRTAVAVRRGDPLPLVGKAEDLKAALLAADEFHVPDTRLSTAGQHIAGMLSALAIGSAVGDQLREHPNGQTAMAALGASRSARPIGCTQVTEILNTPSVTLVRTLPAEFDLATVYTAAAAAKAANGAAARRFAAMLAAPDATAVRASIGFEPLLPTPQNS